ncbi:MAG: lycopene cyclase family protein [Pseudomonadota bacterium]
MSQPWLTIIGGGLAGLSLCDELLSLYAARGERLPGDIMILEQRERYLNDRTFCFFAEQPPQHITYQKYSHWSFSLAEDDRHYQQKGRRYQYFRLAASDVFAHLVARIEHHQQVQLMLGISAESQTLTGGQVVDTRPCKRSDMWIKQCFAGVEIETEKNWDTSAAQLMSNMRLESGRFTFDYILPLTANRALVEVTQFTADIPDQQQLQGYLQQTLNSLGATEKPARQESAVLPMGVLRRSNERLFSQQIRTATGYGYQETKRWAKRCANDIAHQRQPTYNPQSTLLRWFDARLLHIIERRPEQLPEIFMRMAHQLSGDDFARFMSSPSFGCLLKVMAAVPKRPFLRTLYD